MVREEELQQRHHLEPRRVLEQPLHVAGLARLQQPARTVHEDGGGEHRQHHKRVEAD